MKVKLQPPSSTELPAYNPIFSSPPLTQVMIVANPGKVGSTLCANNTVLFSKSF